MGKEVLICDENIFMADLIVSNYKLFLKELYEKDKFFPKDYLADEVIKAIEKKYGIDFSKPKAE